MLSVVFHLDRLAQACSAAEIAGLVGQVVLGVLLEAPGGMDHMGRTGTGLAGGILVLGEDTIPVEAADRACREIQLQVGVDRHDPIVLGLEVGRTEEGIVVVGTKGRLGSAGLGSVEVPAAAGTVVHLALEVLAAVVVPAAVAGQDEIPNLGWQGHLELVAACSPWLLEPPRSASP